jgi:hypothetical protein
MNETIQRFKVVKRCDHECECTADTDLQDDGPLMLVEDHESALAAVQAEVEKLREESSRIIGERRARAAVMAFNLETT